MKHGAEYTLITSMEVGDTLTEEHLEALGTMVQDEGTTPRTVFFEVDEDGDVELEEGHQVKFICLPVIIYNLRFSPR